VKRLQRALGINPSIELREDAPAIRLGAVDDAVAAERLDDAPTKRRSESLRERAPRSFERRDSREPRETRAPRESRERVASSRREHRPSEGAPRPARGFERRESQPARSEGSSRPRGKEAIVSFFNDSKGFGFASDDKGDDLFIHFSSIVGDGFKSLSQGQKITFEEAQGPKGREAKNVRVVGGGRARRY
jgi:CspA family cold shock protein